MAKKNLLLIVDGIVNVALGVLLIFFPAQLTDAFDLPKVETFFYVNILGAVLFGIGIALLLERFASKSGVTGLGIGGAITINLCGSGVLIYWLLFGNLGLSQSGFIFLWSIAIVVLGIAIAELLTKSWKE
ncbi:MAG: hypothetical protein PVJ21_14335 [Anaerolineales bacterium]|jgi:hypothetical protein